MNAEEPEQALPLRVWLLGSHALVLALPLLVVLGTGLYARELQSQTEADLQNQAWLMSLFVTREIETLRDERPDADLNDLGPRLGPLLAHAKDGTLASFRLVDDRGVVVATSGDELGVDLSDRAEVAAALEGARSLSVRPRPPPSSAALGSASRRAQVRLYLGAPVAYEGRTVGAVVLARTPREEVQALYQMVPWWAVLLPILVTLGVALGIGQIATRSLVRLERVSRRIADGQFAEGDQLIRPSKSRISEVRGLASAFGNMAVRLKDRIAWIGEFAGNVSHEFKTPIATLKGTVELLRDDEDMPPEQRARFLDNAHAELERMERLVTGLLSLARVEQVSEQDRVDLDDLLGEVTRRRCVPLRGTAGVILGSRDQLAAVAENLVDNALRHGGAGVAVAAWRTDSQAGFDVIDDGPGISASNLSKVFDRFFTTRRGQGGTGLGLALVRAVCQHHQGEATVESRPGETVFRCAFPVPARRG